jgi:hypothetical protein
LLFTFILYRYTPVFDMEAEVEGDDEDEEAAAKSRILTANVEGGGDVEGVLLRLLRRGKSDAEAAEDTSLSKTTTSKPAAAAAAAAAAKKKAARGKKRGAADEGDEAAGAATTPVGGPYVEVMAHLRKQGPSALDAEIRALGPWDVSTMTDADADELADVLDFFAAEIPSGRNFELLHALLAHFLRVHGTALAERECLRWGAVRITR